MALLIVLGAAMLALAVVVWVLNRDTSSDLLAVGLLLGGLAAVIVVLPRNGKNGGNGGA
jgi:hypothetical protein